jgi:hypothetical protein
MLASSGTCGEARISHGWAGVGEKKIKLDNYGS